VSFGPQDRDHLDPVPGGVTAADGVRAGAVAAGLKPSGRPDLALVTTERPAAAAAVTTTNRVKAAPCLVTEEHVADGQASAVIINSGNANACTGAQGLRDARRTAEAVAEALELVPEQVLPLSTGIIGVPMPMPTLLDGITALVAALTPGGGPTAAQAICTTDSAPKESAYRVRTGERPWHIGGMAKGAGMIEPAMATMLCIITTDAEVGAAELGEWLREATDRTFNRISVDACGSTNDTVIVLATGTSRAAPEPETFRTALEAVCADLAHAVVADGEGTTKVATVTVDQARTEGDAVALARAVSSSVLFRAALHGSDPNWGRILAAMGTTDVDFQPDRVAVTFRAAGIDEAVTVCRDGMAADFDRPAAATVLAKPEVEVLIELGLGDAGASFLSADLTPEYVAENAYYTT
jgi:glutamate N-acetyltransferase / amino-acid N-acetyltransferase